jgi:hypothetical protein
LGGGEVTTSEKAGGVLWVLFSGLLLYETRRYPIGTVDNPGAGFLPLLLGIVLGAMSIIHLFRVWTKKGGRSAPTLWPDRRGLIKSSSILMLLFLFTLLLEITGYLVNTFFLFLLLLRPIGKQKWLWSLSISIGATFASYLLFDWWLMLPLPKGIWFE